MNDWMWDVSDFSIEAGFDAQWDAILLETYLQHKPSCLEYKHFLANKIYVDYVWAVWGLARAPFAGQDMWDYGWVRYQRLQTFLAEYKALDLEK